MSHQDITPLLTIATTLYRSEDTIRAFYERCCAVTDHLGLKTELLFIDDGSPDSSAEILRSLALQDSRIRILEFTRNFGHTAARLAAMNHSRGDLVFLIDCDLEEQPEWLTFFLTTLIENGADAVFGVQENRKGSLFERFSGSVFYWLVKRMGKPEIPRNPVTARLMTRRYVQHLSLYTERDVFLAELWQDIGMIQIPIAIQKGGTSPSTYTFRRKFEQAITAITSVSVLPIYWVAILGATAAILGAFGLVYIGIRAILGVETLQGWSSVMASIWIFGGLSLISIATVGLYVSRIFVEVKNRPRYLIVNEQDD